MRPKEMSGLIMTGILYFEKVFPQYLEENAEYYFIWKYALCCEYTY